MGNGQSRSPCLSTDPSNRCLRHLPRDDTQGDGWWIQRRAGINPAPTIPNPIVGVGGMGGGIPNSECAQRAVDVESTEFS